MKKVRLLAIAASLVMVVGLAGCDDDDEVTGSRGSLARISLDVPDSVQNGTRFDVEVSVENVGVSNVRSAQVVVDLPAPLAVFGVDSSAGTDASFVNGASGARVFWTLGTLDSNSQSRLTVDTAGLLAPGAASTRVTIEASLTGQDIGAGDAVAREDVTIQP